MLDPGRPIEGQRPDRFRPPFCPWKDCPRHRAERRFRCSREGSYRRACDPRRRVPRFRCKTCKRGFSRQSFAGSYYLKRPELLAPIAAGLVAGSAHRQIARSLGCAPSTVTRLAARLGRIALLLQAEALARLGRLEEPIVLDHFETFTFSQDERLGIGTAVGQRTWFVYSFDPAPHRRSGRRGRMRRTPRHPLSPHEPGSVIRSAARVLRLLSLLGRGTVRLVSDDHPAYRAALRNLPPEVSVDHHIYPHPPRRPGCDRQAARARDQAMFPVDLLHKLLRHSQAHHRRETIAFGRRANALLERLALMAVWRNFIKGLSERKPDPTTPAMRLGLTARAWSWREVLSRRRFPGRIPMPEGWMKIYRRGWITPAVGHNQLHMLRHAY
jgi:transposase-like protein